jgi:hypothetical protein
MCGIVAVYSRREPVSPAKLERATKSLYHRGPDGQRQWISRNNRVGLGHARLSIIDLTTGDQPIASEDNLTHIVANGEFYQFEGPSGNLKRGGTGCARVLTARLRYISMKKLVHSACIGYGASLHLRSGTRRNRRCLRPGTDSASSRSFTHGTATRFTWHRR